MYLVEHEVKISDQKQLYGLFSYMSDACILGAILDERPNMW
jgi:hypothetical protein